jgi:hypothetical protein
LRGVLAVSSAIPSLGAALPEQERGGVEKVGKQALAFSSNAALSGSLIRRRGVSMGRYCQSPNIFATSAIH